MDDAQGWRDLVACSGCEYVGHVDKGADQCPRCRRRGVLAWARDVLWALPHAVEAFLSNVEAGMR